MTLYYTFMIYKNKISYNIILYIHKKNIYNHFKLP